MCVFTDFVCILLEKNYNLLGPRTWKMWGCSAPCPWVQPAERPEGNFQQADAHRAHVYTYSHIQPHASDRHPEHSHKHRQHQDSYPAPLPFPKIPVKTLMQFQNSLPLHPTMCLPPLVSNSLLALKRDLGAAPSGWWWWFSCWTKGLRISWDRPRRGSQKVLEPVI